MAKAQRPMDDDIDLFQIIKFFIAIRCYWLIGGLGLFSLVLVYSLFFYPSTHQQQVINDIGLNQEKLSLVRTLLPAMVTPLEEQMRASGLENLYFGISQSDSSFLNNAVIGQSGVDIKDKNILTKDKAKVNAVKFSLTSQNLKETKLGLTFLIGAVRSLNQYLTVKDWFDKENLNSRIKLFNAEAEINGQRLTQERATRQLVAYKKLLPVAEEAPDLQIILNLSTSKEQLSKKSNMNSVEEFSGAKYLPMPNRILAIKSELSDLKEAIDITDRQIEALRLKQLVLKQFETIFSEIPFDAQVVDMEQFINLITNTRSSALTREGIDVLNSLERQMIVFASQGKKFNNVLPDLIKKEGRGKLVIMATIIGGVLGTIIGGVIHFSKLYRRRRITT